MQAAHEELQAALQTEEGALPAAKSPQANEASQRQQSDSGSQANLLVSLQSWCMMHAHSFRFILLL